MRALSIALLAAAVAACGKVDSGTEDAASGFKGAITLEQASSWTVVNGVGCANASGYVTETDYFRVFRLADYDIRGPFQVTSVKFAVWRRAIGAGFSRFPIDVSVHPYTGPIGGDAIDRAAIGAGRTTNVDILATNPENMVVQYDQPLLFDATSDALIARIHVPSYSQQMHKFLFAVSSESETMPGYVACDGKVPETLTGVGYPNYQLLLSVTGEAR